MELSLWVCTFVWLESRWHASQEIRSVVGSYRRSFYSQPGSRSIYLLLFGCHRPRSMVRVREVGWRVLGATKPKKSLPVFMLTSYPPAATSLVQNTSERESSPPTISDCIWGGWRRRISRGRPSEVRTDRHTNISTHWQPARSETLSMVH